MQIIKVRIRGKSATFYKNVYMASEGRTVVKTIASVDLENHAVPLDLRPKFRSAELAEADEWLSGPEAQAAIERYRVEQANKPRRKKRYKAPVTEQGPVTDSDVDAAWESISAAMGVIARAAEYGVRGSRYLPDRHRRTIADVLRMAAMDDIWESIEEGYAEARKEWDFDAMRRRLAIPDRHRHGIELDYGIVGPDAWERFHRTWVRGIYDGAVEMPDTAEEAIESFRRHLARERGCAQVVASADLHRHETWLGADKERIAIAKQASAASFAEMLAESETSPPEHDEHGWDPFGNADAVSAAMQSEADNLIEMLGRMIEQRAEYQRQVAVGEWMMHRYHVDADYKIWCGQRGLEVL